MSGKEKFLFVAQEDESIADFYKSLKKELPNLAAHSLLIQLRDEAAISHSDLLKFQELALLHKKNKKSFVVVYAGADFGKLPDNFQIVPTLQEGEDTIEMEEIERDLGF